MKPMCVSSKQEICRSDANSVCFEQQIQRSHHLSTDACSKIFASTCCIEIINMKICEAFLALGFLQLGSTVAFKTPSFGFSPPQNILEQGNRACTYQPLFASPQIDFNEDFFKKTKSLVRKACTTAFLSAALWVSPVATTVVHDHITFEFGSSGMVASAKEMASGSGSRVNKDPESLLRYGLPIDNKEVRLLAYTVSVSVFLCSLLVLMVPVLLRIFFALFCSADVYVFTHIGEESSGSYRKYQL